MMASSMNVLVAAWATLSCLTLAVTQFVGPSNGTLPVDPNSPQLVLNLKQNSMQMLFDVDPLTLQAGQTETVPQLQAIKITGNLVITNSTSVSNLQPGQLAYISCDNYSYPGPITAEQTISMAASRLGGSNAGAIVLYSLTSNFCNFSPQNGFNYNMLYTTTNSTTSRSLISALTAIGPTGGQTLISIDPDSISSNSTSQQDALGPSPTTAVAMIILYSITGIITALFLTIIITGAVRAHRHPERYGPRNIVGRTRQTRAKGIARAMLESLPIVKFGEQEAEQNKNGSSERDVELGPAGSHDGTTTTPADERTDYTRDESSPSAAEPEGQDAATTEEAPGTTGESGEHNHDDGLACSVCTDEFIKGQNVRVLPCNHKFHPECIDPWLLNVSGTCPLCRVDLRPTGTATDEAESGELSPNPHLAALPEMVNEAPAWLTVDPAATNAEAGVAERRRSHGLSLYVNHTLNLRRMRNATPEERLDALRRVRSVSRANDDTAGRGERTRSRIGVGSRLSRFLGTQQAGSRDAITSEPGESESTDRVVR